MENVQNQTIFKLPRGAKPSPRNKLASAMPYKIIGDTPINFLYRPNTLSFWGNDVNGDCVTAEEAFAKACYSPKIFISDQVAINWAQSNGWLNGANLSEVLDKMITNGFQTNGFIYDDGQHNSVDWTNRSLLQNAISLGPVKIGIASGQLDSVYNYNNGNPPSGWFATGFAPDSAEDHCISLCGYGTLSWLAQQFGVQLPNGVNGEDTGYAIFTWKSIGIIDENSMLAITHEAWLRNPTTVFVGAIKTGPNSYYYEWRGNGVQTINISIPDMHSNSNVMVAISEFSSNSRVDRFMGAAKMRVYNICPYEGGVKVWIEVDWSSPINVVLDLLVN